MKELIQCGVMQRRQQFNDPLSSTLEVRKRIPIGVILNFVWWLNVAPCQGAILFPSSLKHTLPSSGYIAKNHTAPVENIIHCSLVHLGKFPFLEGGKAFNLVKSVDVALNPAAKLTPSVKGVTFQSETVTNYNTGNAKSQPRDKANTSSDNDFREIIHVALVAVIVSVILSVLVNLYFGYRLSRKE